MLLFNKLKAQEGLSDSEKMIAQFVIDRPRDVIDMNIDEFANLNYVSNSSIVRFCQKLDFKGFSDFKIRLASEINTFLVSDKRVEVDMPIGPNTPPKEISTTFLNLYFQTLTDAHTVLDIDSLEEVAKVLEDADVITILATGPSMVVALDFYYRIKRLGYVVIIEPITGYHSLPQVKRSDKEVALIISSFGNSHYVKNWVETEKRLNTPTVMICLNPLSPYLNQVDYQIVLDTGEQRVHKLGHFASRTAMNYILDCLYATMFSLDYEKNEAILYSERDDAKNNNIQ